MSLKEYSVCLRLLCFICIIQSNTQNCFNCMTSYNWLTISIHHVVGLFKWGITNGFTNAYKSMRYQNTTGFLSNAWLLNSICSHIFTSYIGFKENYLETNIREKLSVHVANTVTQTWHLATPCLLPEKTIFSIAVIYASALGELIYGRIKD